MERIARTHIRRLRTRALGSVAFLLAFSVTGCGPANEPRRQTEANISVPGSNDSASTPAETAQTPDPQAACARYAVSPGGTPNIVGLALKMRTTEVAARLHCLFPGAQLSDGAWPSLPTMPDGSRPIGLYLVDTDAERIDVVFAGLQGEERVVGIKRFVKFALEAAPTVAKMRADLLKKYGPLESLYRDSDLQMVRLDAYAAEERLYTKEQDCSPDLARYRDEFSPAEKQCGPFVGVYIMPRRDNAALVSTVAVLISDGIYEERLNAAYRAHVEKLLDTQRREEIERANGRATKL